MKFRMGVVVAFSALAYANYWGLTQAPADRLMGDVYRILYVHVPAAWMALLCYFTNFIVSIGYLLQRRAAWDHVAEATAEVGVVFTALALTLGSIWGKPTWGVWWTWDPRLTTTALMCILYTGYLVLRQLMDDPERRAKVSAGVGLLVFLNVPIVYLSVKWWRSLHQVQSSPSTMDPQMVYGLRLGAFAMLAVAIVFVIARTRLAQRRAAGEAARFAPPPVARIQESL
ncbi:MAG: cytochrome c biogenesis protein CcsA [Deltaproteobacteria bacterium]|nr:cytochrome c biogenesis protein CcsA [Deltaproteobacteria bacterium]